MVFSYIHRHDSSMANYSHVNNRVCLYNHMKLVETLANNLKKWRGNTPQEVFARKLGISQSTLARLERSSQNVTIKTLHQITKALKCNVEDLFK